MIKYFVMGFKKLITENHCPDCDKAIPMLWSLCDDCDYHSFRNIYLRKQVRLEQARLRASQNKTELTSDKIANASILVYDEITGKIIGYKM